MILSFLQDCLSGQELLGLGKWNVSHCFLSTAIVWTWAPESLLEARVCQTWYKGKKVFDEEGGGL
jgi:hypothetical protein